MEIINMGHKGSVQTPGLDLASGKSIKKKKSLPRIFILAQQKSLKLKQELKLSPSRTERPIPALPQQHDPFRAHPNTMSFASIKATTSSTSWRNEPLQEVEGNVMKHREFSMPPLSGPTTTEDDGFSPRNVNTTQNSAGIRTVDENGNPVNHIPSITSPMGRKSEQDLRALKFRRRIHGPTAYAFDMKRGREGSTTFALLPDIDLGPRPVTTFYTRSPDSTPSSPAPHTPLRVGSARPNDSEASRKQRALYSDQWIPWQESYTREDIRQSIRSGLSTGSSALDTCSTEQSSIFTKLSSISDTTIDLDELECGEDGMTVDDCIDLYSAGFDDDFRLESGNPVKPTSAEAIRRRSLRIAEAMNDSIDTILSLPPTSSTPEPPNSAAIMSGEGFRSLFPRPPSIREPSSKHDQYGFSKSTRDISLSQYEAWYAEYSIAQERRTNKWTTFMQEQGFSTRNPTRFPERSAKVQRFVRKGIPPAWRGGAWFFYAGGDKFLSQKPDYYAELVLISQTPKLSANDKEAIERDLHRTFPDNIHFKPDLPSTPSTETALLSSLRRVLCAFAIHNPRIGYCQSLNFLAGMLLLFLPEEKAFWMLHILTTSFLPGTHDLSLEGTNVDLWVLMQALKDAIPSIWAKVGGEVQTNTARLPPVSLCTTSWFMSLFIGTLPTESVLRFWDVLFYEGSRTIFRVALAVFKLGEHEIKAVNDPMEIFQVVQTIPRKMLGVGALMAVACRRGGVSQLWIEKRRRERKDWYAKERAVEKVRRDSRDASRKVSVARKSSKDVVVVRREISEEGEAASLAVSVAARPRGNTWWRTRMGLE